MNHGGGDDIQSEYYRYLFDCAGFAVVGTDCQGMVVSCNRAAEALFEAAREHILGQHIANVFPAQSAGVLEKALVNAVAERQAVEFEAERQGQDGKVITLAVVIAPVLTDAGELLGLAAWARDISNRKALQEQLVEAEKLASLGTLASGVAHHFNNIIGGVATFVDYALHADNPQASRRALQMTAEAASRVGGITQSLLTFAAKDMRQFDLCDLTEVVLTFSHLVENPLADNNIELKLNLTPVPVYEVPGSRLHQVLGNLLENAECAMPDGGHIHIALTQVGEKLQLTFADTGCGISERDLPHVFEPFFTKRGTAGGGDAPCAGLGLSVVHGVVRELGGTIEIQSELNKGTILTIQFPLKPETSS